VGPAAFAVTAVGAVPIRPGEDHGPAIGLPPGPDVGHQLVSASFLWCR
jgi:hypothetical protein